MTSPFLRLQVHTVPLIGNPNPFLPRQLLTDGVWNLALSATPAREHITGNHQAVICSIFPSSSSVTGPTSARVPMPQGGSSTSAFLQSNCGSGCPRVIPNSVVCARAGTPSSSAHKSRTTATWSRIRISSVCRWLHSGFLSRTLYHSSISATVRSFCLRPIFVFVFAIMSRNVPSLSDRIRIRCQWQHSSLRQANCGAVR
jgi:hypothetical protein